jgi:hypothetical protein
METMDSTPEVKAELGSWLAYRGIGLPQHESLIVVGEGIPWACVFLERMGAALVVVLLVTNPSVALSDRHAATLGLARLVRQRATLENRRLFAVVWTKSLLKMLKRTGWGDVGMLLRAPQNDEIVLRKRSIDGEKRNALQGSGGASRDGSDGAKPEAPASRGKVPRARPPSEDRGG